MTEIRIVWCKPCGYLPRTKELENNLKKTFGNKISIESVPGEHGIFDVFVDDKLIFSKWKERRFPEFEEIKTLVETRIK